MTFEALVLLMVLLVVLVVLAVLAVLLVLLVLLVLNQYTLMFSSNYNSKTVSCSILIGTDANCSSGCPPPFVVVSN